MKNKKVWVSVLAGIMAALMLLSLLAGLFPTRAGAKTLTSEKLEETKAQIKELKGQQDVLQEQMDALRDQIDDNMSEMEAITAEKTIIDQEVGLLNQQILNINAQITAYGLLIADKQEELDIAKERLQTLTQQYKVRIRVMEEEGPLSYWSVLFKANSFSDLLDRLNMIEEIAAADRRRLAELDQAAQEVALAQEALEAEKAELEKSKQELDEAQALLAVKREEADAVLLKLFEKGEEFEALMDEAEANEEELIKQIAQAEKEYNKEMNRLEEEEEKRLQALLQQQQQQQQQKPGTGSVGSADAVPSNATWLVPCSYVYLSSPFGWRVHPVYGDWRFHSGVDLAAPGGTPIYATRGGTVTAATYNSSSGYYVTVNHGDGFSSSYLHMTHYVVSVGQKVSAGQLLGYVGSTGTSTGNHLHFSIYYNGNMQNPAAYINFR